MCPDRKMEWFKKRNYSLEDRKKIKALVIERWTKRYQRVQSNTPTPEPAVCLIILIYYITYNYFRRNPRVDGFGQLHQFPQILLITSKRTSRSQLFSQVLLKMLEVT